MTKSIRGEVAPDGAVESVDLQSSLPWPDTVLTLTKRRIANGVELATSRHDLYQALLDEAMRTAPAKRGNVRLYDRKNRQSVFSVTAGDSWTDEILHRVYKDTDPSACAHAVLTRELYVIDDVKEAKDYVPLWDDVRSHVSIPLFLNQEVVAVLSLDAENVAAFKPALCSSLRHLGVVASNVLAHFALFEMKWRDEFEHFMMARGEVQVLCLGAIEHLTRLFGVLGCSIFLLHPGSKSLTLAATTGIKHKPDEVPAYEVGEGLTGWVAKHARTLRLRNSGDQLELARFGDDLHWQNLWPEEAAENNGPNPFGFLGAPLISCDRVIGVLRLASKESGADFEVEDEILLEQVAERFALCVSSAWAIKNIVVLNERLAETLDLETVCRIVMEHGLQLVGYDFGNIRIFDPLARNLRMVAANGPAPDIFPKVRGLGEGVSGVVAQQGKERCVTDLSADEELLAAVAAGEGPRRSEFLGKASSVACFPLVAQGNLVGTLNMYWAKPHIFTLAELGLMRGLALRSALAVRAALMHQEIEGDLKARIRYLSQLREMFLDFSRIRNSSELFDKILKTAIDVADVGSGSIWLRDQGLDVWRPMAACNRVSGPDALSIFPKQVDIPEGTLGEYVQSGEARSIHDFVGHSQYSRLVQKYGGTPFGQHIEQIRSLVVVPFDIEHHCIGVLALSSPAPAAFPQSTIEYLEILGGYAATAIEDARLYEEHERALRLAEPLAIMGAMMSGFQHELRNVAHRISTALDNVQDPKIGTEEVPTYAGRMRVAVDRLSSICDDMVLFAGMERDSSAQAADLNEALRGALGRTTINEHLDIQCDLQLIEPSPIVRGNPVHLRQCLEFIIGNAIEAMPKGGRLLITTSADDGVKVRVEDTGVGMDKATKARCLEPFFTTKAARGGTGLGLSVVAGLMKRHGGSIGIDSELGKGTTVTLLLPKQEAS
jgi:signal transduction histidine kinase/tRNA threonylcarbamoyladenosine modification (KEOPS) complex  Pcc1 subunit